jgi:starch-binding outer membrane protein, SusD/RagB family
MKKLIYIFLVSGMMISCSKDFTDLPPYDALPREKAIVDESSMQSVLAGVYRSATSPSLFGRAIPIIGDLYADNTYQSAVNSNRYTGAFQYNYTVASGDVVNFWSAAYVTILRANNVINANLASTANIDQLRGEALFLRALTYHALVQYFAKPYTSDPNAAGVPVITSYDPFKQPERNSVSEVYELIESDLTEAFGLMSISKNSGFVNKYAAKALLARVYLTKGEWQNAKDAALEVINNGGYSLLSTSNFQSYWNSASVRTDKVETIFELSLDAVVNNSSNSLAYMYDQIGYGDILVTNSLYNTYSATDVRRGLIVDGTRAGINVKVARKYPNEANSDKDNVKILRLAEMVLTVAEASYRLNDEVTALNYLNMIAARRGVTPYASIGAALLEDIIRERRLEFAFEGMRYPDLQRLNRDVERVNLNSNYPATVPLEILFSSHKRIFPIPQTERDANPNISQNEGY